MTGACEAENVSDLIKKRFPLAGCNKRQELVRLVSEIVQREKVSASGVIRSIPSDVVRFEIVKNILIKRRFPELTSLGVSVVQSFSALDVRIENKVDLKRKRLFVPRQIYIEASAKETEIAVRAMRAFPDARVMVIDSYREFVRGKSFSILDYNHRTDNLFIVWEKFDYFRVCPCSKGMVRCGYHNINLGFGCSFECSYCFLQSYTNAPGIVLPTNIEDILKVLPVYPEGVRIGSGETTDSLVFDHITGFSKKIVDFFQSRPGNIFEFKTKSDNVNGLLAVKAAANVVVAWSVNPQSVINDEEHFTASLDERLDSARACAQAGYQTAFHFDPIVYYNGWENDYADLVDRIFSWVSFQNMAWISLGTLRMTCAQKKSIENRFPENTILSAEFVSGIDGKCRYHESIRIKIYRIMSKLIDARSFGKVPVYLCMEPKSVWSAAGLASF